MSDEANTVTSYLTADHRRLDAILDEVIERARAGDARTALERFDLFRAGLERHIEIEERLLFPMFEERTGMRTGPTSVMRTEHGLIRDGMEVIHTRLSNNTLESALGILEQLTALLGRHNGKEERILYPTSDRVAAADLPELLRQMAEYPGKPETASAC